MTLNYDYFPGVAHINSFGGIATPELPYRYRQPFGAPAVVTTPAFASGYGLQCSPGVGVETVVAARNRVDGAFAFRSGDPTRPTGMTKHGLAMSLVVPAFSAPDHLVLAEWWDHDSSLRAHALWLYSDGRIALMRGGTIVAATTPGKFRFGRRCHISVGVFLHGSVGSVGIRVYGATWVDLAGSLNTAENGLLQASLLRVGNLVADNSVTVLIGDLYAAGVEFDYTGGPIEQTGVVTNALNPGGVVPGHVAVLWHPPYGQASITAAPGTVYPWQPGTSTNWQAVDDPSPDGNGSYLFTVSPGAGTTRRYDDRFLVGPFQDVPAAVDTSEGIGMVAAAITSLAESGGYGGPSGPEQNPATMYAAQNVASTTITGAASTYGTMFSNSLLYNAAGYGTAYGQRQTKPAGDPGVPTDRAWVVGDTHGIGITQQYTTLPANPAEHSKPFRVTQFGVEVCHQLPVYISTLPPNPLAARIRTWLQVIG